jgi:hypothetical protein
VIKDKNSLHIPICKINFSGQKKLNIFCAVLCNLDICVRAVQKKAIVAINIFLYCAVNEKYFMHQRLCNAPNFYTNSYII